MHLLYFCNIKDVTNAGINVHFVLEKPKKNTIKLTNSPHRQCLRCTFEVFSQYSHSNPPFVNRSIITDIEDLKFNCPVVKKITKIFE